MRRASGGTFLLRLCLGASSLALPAQSPSPAAPTAAQPGDKYTWLEDVSGPRSMAWVKAENARSDAILQHDPRYRRNFDEALAIEGDPHRLPEPMLMGESDEVYNQWTDATNPRGLLRKTTLASYGTAVPEWQTVINFDALGKKEGVGWVSKGLTCLYPENSLCMVRLSNGGEDAVTDREFNLQTAAFVQGGFALPHSKQDVAWVDHDSLLVSRDWGPGTLTQSGYPFVAKLWKRGTPLDSAQEVVRGAATDQVGVTPLVLNDAEGHRAVMVIRGVTFFSSEKYLQTPQGMQKLEMPGKADVEGLLRGQLLVHLHEDWQVGGQTFPQGSLVALPLDLTIAAPQHLKPVAVSTPTSQEFLDGFSTTRDHLLVTTLNHVQSRAYRYSFTDGQWTRQPISVPANVNVDIESTRRANNDFFLREEGFLQPPAVFLGNGSAGASAPAMAKSEPALFDASGLVVEQLEATSKDGTKVPYFVVHRQGMPLDGSHPTLLTAYGGFEVSMTPTYSAIHGKLWLAKGGVLVQANIRGGGEFGPAWHEAGLTVHRQRIYDDFAAVGQDLVSRGVTSSRRLGIMGGSNGGLLMGVEMEQHPDLWHAVVIGVPLLDMLGYEHIAAGASWVGEYGGTAVPEQRAFLASISPYNNLKPNAAYPDPLIWTTTKDDRVGPQHARKFAAEMEEFHEPFLFEEVIEGGHGSGADLQQKAATDAFIFTYLDMRLD